MLPVIPALGAILIIGNLIHWWTIPWIWALAPFWIPLAILAGLGVIALILATVIAITE